MVLKRYRLYSTHLFTENSFLESKGWLFMAGGHGTHSGIGFQDKVAAVIAIYLLANEPLPFFDLPRGATVSGLAASLGTSVLSVLS